MHRLRLTWTNHACTATLDANLRDYSFSVAHDSGAGEKSLVSYPR